MGQTRCHAKYDQTANLQRELRIRTSVTDSGARRAIARRVRPRRIFQRQFGRAQIGGPQRVGAIVFPRHAGPCGQSLIQRGAMIKAALIGVVKAYRLLLKAWIGASCRFEPSCSAYALQALEIHGAATGSYLTVTRLARCHPWCAGGCDPVPPKAPRLFAWLLTQSSHKKPS